MAPPAVARLRAGALLVHAAPEAAIPEAAVSEAAVARTRTAATEAAAALAAASKPARELAARTTRAAKRSWNVWQGVGGLGCTAAVSW